jgi:hypothetical protein
MHAYVLHSTHLGTFLGLWSQSFESTSFVPEHALTFATPEIAMRLADQFDPPPLGLTVVQVEADMPCNDAWFASVAACVASGLEPWITHETETINTMPS